MAELKVMVAATSGPDVRGPLLGVLLSEQPDPDEAALAMIDARAGNVIRATIERGDFRGQDGETAVLYPPEGGSIERIVLSGLGKPADAGEECVRRAVGNAVRQAEKLHVDAVGFVTAQVAAAAGIDESRSAYLLAETSVLAAWDYRDLKTAGDDEPGEVRSTTLYADGDAVGAVRTAADIGETVGRAANFARGLAIRPGNIATPTFLADAAKSLADRFGMNLTVLDRQAMQREGMKGLLAVAAGSEEEPRFIVLEYRGGAETQAPLVLIGKGVTFDSGGISIKPAAGMEEMKFDMSGAAGVLGAMQGIAELDLAINVVALVPSTENLLSGRAVKPGDVIGSHLGKTIEVVNTDAEGRLILCDALTYAERFDPDAVIDIATLTGACVVALGEHPAGLLSNHRPLVNGLLNAGQASGDRCWELPLWDDYQSQLDSNFADMANIGGKSAGAITAACFLSRFAKKYHWAHLDIAGIAWRSGKEKGATGRPVGLLVQYVLDRIAE